MILTMVDKEADAAKLSQKAGELARKARKIEEKLEKVRSEEKKTIEAAREADQRPEPYVYPHKAMYDITEAVKNEFPNLEEFRSNNPGIYDRVVDYVVIFEKKESTRDIGSHTAKILNIIEDATFQAQRSAQI